MWRLWREAVSPPILDASCINENVGYQELLYSLFEYIGLSSSRGLGGCLCNPPVQAGGTPGLLLPPVRIFLVVAGLALFSKLLLSDWWLCRCYESSKEALLKGTSDAKAKLSPPPPLPTSGSAVLAWLMLHLLNHAKPPVWRDNGKERLADSPYKQMLTATQS